MHNFDPERKERQTTDRDFILGGMEFRRRASVRPEVMIEFEDLPRGAGAAKSLQVMDNLIIDYLEPEYHDAYRELRQREEDAVNARDLAEVVNWLIGGSTGRPTGAPSHSTGGRATTGTDSTEGSSTEPDEDSKT